MSCDNLIQLEKINLNYGDVIALKNIDFHVVKSEIHAIVGEHGAGKSTLAKILCGLLQTSSGRIIWEDKLYKDFTLQKARSLGIRIVGQENPTLDALNVADNFLMSNPSAHRIFKLKRKKNYDKIFEFVKKNGFGFDFYQRMEDLPLADKALVETLKQLYSNPKLLILDDTLQKIGSSNISRIYIILQKLVANGSSVVIITDRFDDIYKYADRVTIIKAGEIVFTDSIKNVDKLSLIRFAYTQLQKERFLNRTNSDFNNLLKYNQAILENLPLNLLVIDKDFNIKLVNDNAKNFFKISSTSFLKTIFSEILCESENVIPVVKKALEKNEKNTLFNTRIVISGSIRSCDIIIYPIFDESVKIGYIIIFHDITEQEKMKEQLNLQEQLSTVGLLAAGIAHEINNPLDIINNCLDYFKLKIEDKELVDNLHDIEEEINSISQIVGNLTSLTKDTKTTNEAVEINELIELFINLVKHYARERKVHIEFIRKRKKIEIQANKTEIKQVLLNVTKNSFDAMPDGGTISITSDSIRNNGKSYALITIQDTGAGLENDQLRKIFEPFYTTKSETSYNLGLGLFTSYSIVKKYDGKITAENVPSGGLKISVSFKNSPIS